VVCELSVVVFCPHCIGELFLHALLFTVPIVLLLVSRLQAARVVRGHLRITVVLTLFAHPVDVSTRFHALGLAHSIAASVYRQHAVLA
jgi:hypothetical protein